MPIAMMSRRAARERIENFNGPSEFSRSAAAATTCSRFTFGGRPMRPRSLMSPTLTGRRRRTQQAIGYRPVGGETAEELVGVLAPRQRITVVGVRAAAGRCRGGD